MSDQVAVGITVNGEDKTYATAPTVAELLAELGLPEKGIAVAIDGAVCPRGRWSEPVNRGANIEILTAVQGG
ncbi:sulfur carrier protein ThiS [Rhodococcus sp. Z13]|uniref:Sulfur carrier protein ThiS n=1 Tax=Rhodococcus sacchari TaxID=2962047 RepID=A0ACD4DE03_9NOCA|nr:sulfur carrier protein ThiS [Rhodococcus sp. Z13]UYP18300.1 sulfur carrier protein ThiS [Rhodococcus sp. Z13]